MMLPLQKLQMFQLRYKFLQMIVLLYHYLHEEHKGLAPAITNVLKRMLLDGTVSEMRRETIRELVGEREP